MTMLSPIPGKYAVVGNPIKHSLSPDIHRHFAKQLGRSIDYGAVELTLGKFAEQVFILRESDYRGINVTVPFKTDAYELADTLTAEAQSAGAANTLLLSEHGIIAHNSDGIGLVTALNHHDYKIASKRLLILGAGGAVAGILASLLNKQPAALTIANRTITKAIALAARFSTPTLEIAAVDYETLGDASRPDRYDGIIHATSLGLQGLSPEIPDMVLRAANWAYDMMYASQPTPFLTHCQSVGLVTVTDGWGMLVAQAAESYRFWHSQTPDIKPLLASHP